ncbi:MAG: tetratricopeptide repeat protein [Hyphomicrobium sp.]
MIDNDTTCSRKLTRAHIQLGTLSIALVLSATTAGRAEPVLDRALNSARVVAKSKTCEIIKIAFNFRVRYVSHFPLGSGTDLRIMVRAIDPGVAASEILTRRESLRVPPTKIARLRAIELDIDPAGGPALNVQFAGAAHFDVAEGQDFESIIIAVSDGRGGRTCRPTLDDVASAAWAPTIRKETAATEPPQDSGPQFPPRTKTRTSGAATDADKKAAAAALDEARAALKKQRLNEAMKLLAKILALPETEQTAEAQELMGLARQRSGDLAEAQAEYEDYLQHYPQGEGAERVRQRLAGVTTAKGGGSGQIAGESTHEKFRPRRQDDGTSMWTFSGSASQFYIRDDSFHTLHDPSLPPDLSNDPDEHRVHQNELLSSLDLVGTWQNADAKWKFRFSGSEEHSFATDEDEFVSVAALFAEANIRDWNTLIRAGRQTRNTGGVLGRFDGALVGWQASDWLGVNVVAGSPVRRRSDEPFMDDKYFAGLSFDIGRLYEGLDINVFAIEQLDRDIVDREAVGFEARYLTPSLAAFASVDYDLHFGDFNSAVVSGTWTLLDKSTLHAGAEYRKFPYLSAWNALQGQPFITLYDLLKTYSIDDVDQLAIDRTASYQSANLGLAHPINEHLQVTADVTIADTSGTVASGGVDATPTTGTEFYYSAQLIANDMAADGDMFIAGLRVADREDSNLYVVDLNTRIPITPDLRVGPRVRFGYRDGDTSDLEEYSVLPSLLVNYFVTRNINFEVEAGAYWTNTRINGVEETETELFITAGYRYDFQADGRIR